MEYTSSFGGSFFDMGGSFGPPPVFTFCFAAVFIAVFCLVLFAIVRGVSQWHSNNRSPRLTVNAGVVTKRMDVTRHPHGNAGGTSATWYYATFEVEGGDRLEFSVSGSEYGLLAEGDRGRLTFQGTRYLGFERQA